MRYQFFKGAVAGGVGAAVVMAASAALAGSGVGGVFNLGRTNTVGAQTTLTGNAGSVAQLRVQNTGGGPAFAAVVKPGAAPFTVSSSVRVHGLNADKLDGIDSTGFLRAIHVLHGAADANGPAKRLFFDSVTGALVRHHGIGEVEIKNTNAHDALEVDGISTQSSDEVHWRVEIGPGDSAIFPEQTIEPFFLDLMVTRLGADASTAASLHLTCNVGDNSTTGLVALSCLGVT
jgi:hypothetical protein